MSALGSDSEREQRWTAKVRQIADEAVARCQGGPVDGTVNRRKPSIGNILTMLVMAGGLVTSYGVVVADNAKRDLRIDTIEKRQVETRQELKADIQGIKQDVGQVRDDVQKVLRAVERINGRMEERDRRDRP